jgi:putative transposase
MYYGAEWSLIAYRFRLYPTRIQTRIMSETIETCRLLYNDLLDDRIKNGTNCFAQKKVVSTVRNENKFLKAVHSQVVQDVVFRLDKSYARFSVGLSRKPRFKRRGRYNSFTYPQLGGFKIVDGRLRLSKIGLVKARFHRLIEGIPKTCTIVRDVDRWFACISAHTEKSGNAESKFEAPAVGVDLGILNLATLSDSKTFENPRYLRNSITRIKLLQRQLSRKRKGSSHREKARIMLAKAWRKVRNQRSDVAHKISGNLATGYSTIVFEELHIPDMVKNHNLASAIMDASWGKLRQLTAYKAEKRGGRVILVNPRGTSQKCSGCGEMVPKALSERIHTCPRCGLVVDRDVNAARNILRAGPERARVKEQPLPVQRRRAGKLVPTKQEAHSMKREGFSRV